MRFFLASARRAVIGLAVGLALAALAACPAPQSPKGPPPLYEDPPAPSWLDGGGGGGGGGGAQGATAEGGAPGDGGANGAD